MGVEQGRRGWADASNLVNSGKDGAERPLEMMPVQPLFGMSCQYTWGWCSGWVGRSVGEAGQLSLLNGVVNPDSLGVTWGDEGNVQPDQDGLEGLRIMIEKKLLQLVTMMTKMILRWV